MVTGFAVGFGIALLASVAANILQAWSSKTSATNEQIALRAMLASEAGKVDAESQLLAVEEQRDDAIATAKKVTAERDDALARLAAVAKQRDQAQEAAHAPSPTAAVALAGVNAELSALSDVPATGDGGAGAAAGTDHGHAGQDAVRPAAAAPPGGPGRRS